MSQSARSEEQKESKTTTPNKQISIGRLFRQDIMTSPLVITVNMLRKQDISLIRSLKNKQTKGEFDLQSCLRESLEENVTVTDCLMDRSTPKTKKVQDQTGVDFTSTVIGSSIGAVGGMWMMKTLTKQVAVKRNS